MRPVHLAASKDKLRPILNFIQIKDGFVNTTNGFILASIPAKDVFGVALFSKEEEFYINADDFARLKGYKALGFSRDGNHVFPQFKKESGFPIKLYTPEEVGQFPNVQAVIPETPKELNLIGVDAELLQKAQKILQTECVKLEFYGKERGIKVTCLKQSDNKGFCLVMPRFTN